MGYHRSGFDVVGVDHRPQPRYPFEFIRADAMMYLKNLLDTERDNIIDPEAANACGYLLSSFAAIHASPPCQHYSVANNIHGRKDHPDLIAPCRQLLMKTGLPYVIENVPRSPLRMAVQICGLALGLNARRHRWFESNVLLFGTSCGDHSKDYVIVFGGGGRGRAKQIGRTLKGGPIIRRPTIPVEKSRIAMGIDWMNRDELSQAIPPAYTEFLGRQLVRIVENTK